MALSIIQSTATLNNNDIKALPTTPFEVLAAPGAGIVNVPIFYVLKGVFQTAYANIDAAAYGNLQWAGLPTIASGYIANDATSSPPLTSMDTFFGTSTVTWIHILRPYEFDVDAATLGWGQFPLISATGNIVNQAIELVIENNGSGNLTGGNAINSLDVTTIYIQVPV